MSLVPIPPTLQQELEFEDTRAFIICSGSKRKSEGTTDFIGCQVYYEGILVTAICSKGVVV